MLQYIIGYGYQCIFFAIHHTVFTNHSQAIHIRIYNKSHICLTAFHKIHDISQILFKRLRIVCKVSGRLTIELFYMLHAQTFQQLGKYNSTNRIYTIDRHTEVCFLNSVHIHQVECQHTVNMLCVISKVFAIRTEMVYIGIIKFFRFGNAKNFISFGCIQELAMLVEKLQSIPLFRIMRSSQDNTSASSFHRYSQLGSRSRSKINIYYIPTHTHKSTDYYVLHHFTGDTCITAYNDFITGRFTCFTNQSGISRREFHYVKRVQSLACPSANRSADTRDRFD